MSIHALDRLKERYRSDCDLSDLRAIEALIIAGKAKEVGKRYADRQEYFVTYQKKRLRVLFSRQSARIVTVLPLRLKPPRPRRMIFRDGRIVAQAA